MPPSSPIGRDHGGAWRSQFQPNSIDEAEWYPEELVVAAPGDGTFQSETAAPVDQARFHWTAAGVIVNDEFASGTWKSNKPGKKSAGTFVLNIDAGGQCMAGFLLGRSEWLGAINFGAWVLARPGADPEPVKGHLADLVPGFRKFVFLGSRNTASAKLRDLPNRIALTDGQKNLLREAVRCLESGANRAAAVCGWALAFDVIRRYVWDDPARQGRLQAVWAAGALTTYDDLADEPSERKVLDRMSQAGLLPKSSEKLKHYLKERNEYAHANDLVPTDHQVNHYLEDLVDLLITRFKG